MRIPSNFRSKINNLKYIDILVIREIYTLSDYDISPLSIVNFSNFKALPVDKDISQQEIVNFITLTMECGEISRSTGSRESVSPR